MVYASILFTIVSEILSWYFDYLFEEARFITFAIIENFVRIVNY